MKYFLSLFLFSLIVQFFPVPSQAAEPVDAYADAVVSSSGKAYRPSEATGAPDESYLDFLAKDAEATFDMGAGEEGTGHLTIYFKILNIGATYQVEFLAADFHVFQKSAAAFPLYVNQVIVAYDGNAPYRYVRIRSVEEEEWRLDAMEAASFMNPPEQEEPEPASLLPPEEQKTVLLRKPTTRGTVYKLPDDGNPTTAFDSAVYVIGADGKRHAFMNEAVFRSWFADFSGVETVQLDSLTVPLGKNVTLRAGTYLVKIASSPLVYAVEPGGILRWIKNETIARALYGTEWARKVMEVPDSFFSNYIIGKPIDTVRYPTGTVAATVSGKIMYVQADTMLEVSEETFAALGFHREFLAPVSDAVFVQYRTSGPLAVDLNFRFPF